MTVQEVIEELKKYPPDMKVMVEYHGELVLVMDVDKIHNDTYGCNEQVIYIQ